MHFIYQIINRIGKGCSRNEHGGIQHQVYQLFPFKFHSCHYIGGHRDHQDTDDYRHTGNNHTVSEISHNMEITEGRNISVQTDGIRKLEPGSCQRIFFQTGDEQPDQRQQSHQNCPCKTDIGKDLCSPGYRTDLRSGFCFSAHD